jgi:hypothetical protein
MRTSKPLSRKVHIDEKEWSYFVGKDNVKIRNPTCTKSFVVTMQQLGIENLEPWGVVRDPVTPQIVKDYIIKNL